MRIEEAIQEEKCQGNSYGLLECVQETEAYITVPDDHVPESEFGEYTKKSYF